MDATFALTSSIDSVMVYRRGARVTRTASLAAVAERLPGTAKVGGLPLGMDDGSVRVRVVCADGTAPPVAHDLRVALEVGAIDPTLPPPESPELRAARRRAYSLREEMVRLSDEQSRLRGIEQSPRPEGKRGEAPPASPFDARMALVAFVADRSAILDARMGEVATELLAVEEELAACLARDREASSARSREAEQLSKSIVVRLDGGDARAASLVVSYVVAGARWCPTYSLQSSAGLSTVRLSVRGAVCQSTGEDWRGVALTLSTAEPDRWHELPTLASLRIGKRQPRAAARAWRPPPVDTQALFVAYDEGRPNDDGPREEKVRAMPMRLLGRPAIAGGRVRAQSYQTTARDDDEDTMVNRPASDLSIEKAKRASEPVPPSEEGSTELLRRAGSEQRLASAYAASTIVAADAAAAYVPQAQAYPARARHPLPTASMGRAKSGGLLAGLGDLLGGGGGGPSLDEEYDAAMPTLAPAGAPLAKPGPSPHQMPVEDEPLLAFDTLRMAGADSADRGTLVAVETRERYVEELVRIRGTLVRETLLVALDSALEIASIGVARVDMRALPPRCVDPGSSQGFDYAYPAVSRVDVPSDGSFHVVPLVERESPAQLRHVVVPRQSTDVFRVLELDNPIDAPLLEGPVDVYLSGRYVVTSDLHTVPAGGRISLGIGVEQRVKVARNSRYAEETEGLMRGTIALKHEVSIELASHLDEPCDIEVRERLPTALENDDEVRVDVGKVDPPWEPWDPKLDVGPPLKGGYRWRVTLPRGEKRNLVASYVIRTSSKNELHGGNRRER